MNFSNHKISKLDQTITIQTEIMTTMIYWSKTINKNKQKPKPKLQYIRKKIQIKISQKSTSIINCANVHMMYGNTRQFYKGFNPHEHES